jgi:dipeptidase E
MVNLLLSGGGRRADAKLVKILAGSLEAKGRLLYIPVALPVERISYGQGYDWITSTHTRNGLNRIDMWTDLEDRQYAELEKYSAIFIGGGNTFKLLKLLRETGFDRPLLKYLKSQRPVFGGSAGAIIFGRDIGTAYFGGDADENEVHLKNLKGMDVVKGYSIACHHNGLEYDIFAKDYSMRTKNPVIALKDGTGIQLKGERIIVLGPDSAKTFNGKNIKVFKAGSTIE